MRMMRLPATDWEGPGHMEVARLARWLWQRNGSQPGHYREYWERVQWAICKQQTYDSGLSFPGFRSNPEQATQPLKITTTLWEEIAWEAPVLIAGSGPSSGASSLSNTVERPAT